MPPPAPKPHAAALDDGVFVGGVGGRLPLAAALAAFDADALAASRATTVAAEVAHAQAVRARLHAHVLQLLHAEEAPASKPLPAATAVVAASAAKPTVAAADAVRQRNGAPATVAAPAGFPPAASPSPSPLPSPLPAQQAAADPLSPEALRVRAAVEALRDAAFPPACAPSAIAASLLGMLRGGGGGAGDDRAPAAADAAARALNTSLWARSERCAPATGAGAVSVNVRPSVSNVNVVVAPALSVIATTRPPPSRRFRSVVPSGRTTATCRLRAS
jgi:hypothetical protein